MSHTNETPNFHLPQFTAMDKPDWLVDVNDAFQAIDTGMASTQSEAESATSTAQLAQTTAEGAAETADQASSDVAGLTTNLETLQGTVNTVTALIGNGTPTTTDKTIIGAINELAAVVEPDSVEVTADGVKTYGALIGEVRAAMNASKISYRTVFELIASGGTHSPLHVTNYGGATVSFDFATDGGSGKVGDYHLIISAGNDEYTYRDGSAETNLTNNVAPSGMKLKLIY